MHLVGFEPTTLLFTQFGMSFDLELIGVLIFTFYYHLSVEKSSQRPVQDSIYAHS